jgi:predicted nucleotide-binding protein (sugar kinase/HSP70/actin superfamily)
MIIGEFWAMTTEGDGNYHLQRFLEQEGAEVDIQLTTAWILYTIWQNVYDTKKRMHLRGVDESRHALNGVEPLKKIAMLKVADKALRGWFHFFAKTMGLNGYHLPDMGEVADVAHEFYPVELRGGEGHMEVGKVILAAEHAKAHMVLSVKPFGCMPSSGVSDGVQSLVTTRYPGIIFCPIETSGDGEVNAHSRIQMYLFKARRKAKDEFENLLQERGMTVDEANKKLKRRSRRALHYPKHVLAGTGANMIQAL